MRYLKLFIEFNKQIKSRPTKYFFFLILVFFALFLQAYMHNYNIVYIVLFFTFSVAGSSCLVGRLNLLPLKVEAVKNEEIFANKSVKINLKILNDSKSSCYAFSVEKVDIDVLEEKSSRIVQVPKIFDSRGYHFLKNVNFESFFPFGHIRFSKKVVINERYLIYPNPQGIPLKKAYAKELAQFGEIDSFEDLKEYEAGESLAKIHWASVAKGELKSKKFNFYTEDKTLHFYFNDISGSTHVRLSQLTLWVLEATKLGFAYIVHIKNKDLNSKIEGKDEILKQLSLY